MKCISAFFSIILLLACGDQPDSMQKQIQAALSSKYNEPFVINEVAFSKGLNLYQFEASPKKNKAVLFRGRFDERLATAEKQLVTDSYPNNWFSFEANTRFQEGLRSKFQPFVSSVSVSARYEHSFGQNMVDLDTYLENRVEKSSIRHNLYLFQTPLSPADPMVSSIREVLLQLIQEYGYDVSFYVGFWKPEFIEGKNFEDLTWGFQSTTEKDADDILNVMTYLSDILFVKVKSKAAEELSKEELFSLIEPHKKKGQNTMKEI